MQKKVTIYDVATEAGVSLATVSRVINGSNVVRPQTRDRVLDAIQRLDFKPNEIARGLAKSKTTTIAIVFPQSLFVQVKDMIGGIGDVSRHLDYNIILYTISELGDGDPIEEIMERVVKSRADGVILFNDEGIEKEIELMHKYKIPAVVIGTRVSNDTMGSVFVDSRQMISEIINRYLAQGKKDILFVEPKFNLIDIEQMIKGIQDVYHQHQLEFDSDKQIIRTSKDYEDYYSSFKEYFKDHKHDLVISGYDKEAVAVVNAARDNGLSIPEDMEVIGMMDTNYGLMCRPSLTSVHVPVYDMGALAVRLLTKMLNDEEIETKEVAVRYTLISRSTTKN